MFDELTFDTVADAETALRRNGFSKYLDDDEAQKFSALPQSQCHQTQHLNGRIYSSGRFCR